MHNYEQKIKLEHVGGSKPSRPVTAQGAFEEVHFRLCSTPNFTFLTHWHGYVVVSTIASQREGCGVDPQLQQPLL